MAGWLADEDREADEERTTGEADTGRAWGEVDEGRAAGENKLGQVAEVQGRVRTFFVPSFFVILPFLMSLTLLFSTGNEDAAWQTRLCQRMGTKRDKWSRSRYG